MFCRLCALDKTHTLPILKSGNLEIAPKLLNLVSLQVSEKDVLPNTICLECLSTINKFNDFKTSVIQAQSILELLFPKFEDIEIEEETQEIIDEEDNIEIIDETNYLNSDPFQEAQKIENIDLKKLDDESQVSQAESFVEETSETDDYQNEDENNFSDTKDIKKNLESSDSETYEIIEIIPDDMLVSLKNQSDTDVGDVSQKVKYDEAQMNETKKSIQRRRRDEFKELECNECGDLKKSQKELIKHFQNDHKNKTAVFKCRYCPLFYEKYRSFTRHVAQHTDEARFKCNICDRKFAQKISLQNHLHAHDSNRTFECNFCDLKFKQHASLYNHKKLHAEKEYECEFCNVKFSLLYLLKQHKKAKHLNVKDKICKECGKGYSSSAALSYHMLTHSKKIYCKICKQSFSTLVVFTKHNRKFHRSEVNLQKTEDMTLEERRRHIKLEIKNQKYS